jgi:hypothetical protein
MRFVGWLLAAFLLLGFASWLLDAVLINASVWLGWGAAKSGEPSYAQYTAMQVASTFVATLAALWFTRRRVALNTALWWAGVIIVVLSAVPAGLTVLLGAPVLSLGFLALISLPLATALAMAAAWALTRPTGVFPPLRTSASSGRRTV